MTIIVRHGSVQIHSNFGFFSHFVALLYAWLKKCAKTRGKSEERQTRQRTANFM